MLKCGENTKIAFLADDANSKWIWIDGLVLACNFEVISNFFFIRVARLRMVVFCLIGGVFFFFFYNLLQTRMRSELMQEVMDLFVVESELDLLASQHLQSKPPIPPRPDNLDFASGPIEVRTSTK